MAKSIHPLALELVQYNFGVHRGHWAVAEVASDALSHIWPILCQHSNDSSVVVFKGAAKLCRKLIDEGERGPKLLLTGELLPLRVINHVLSLLHSTLDLIDFSKDVLEKVQAGQVVWAFLCQVHP